MKSMNPRRHPVSKLSPLRLVAPALLALAALIALPATAAADQPAPADTAAVVSTVVPAAAQAQPVAASEEQAEPQIVIYTTSWCGYCRKAIKLLDELEVEYDNRDVEKDTAAREAHRGLTGGRGGVPVLNIDGTIIRGFNEAKIRQAIEDLEDSR